MRHAAVTATVRYAPPDTRLPGGGALLAAAILVPALLGLYPTDRALIGLGLRPALWVAIAWQLATAVAWTLVAGMLLMVLRRRTDRNVRIGNPPLSITQDAAALAAWCVLGAVAHAVLLSATSALLMLGRDRPPPAPLTVDILLLYAPASLLTLLGVTAVAFAAAEHRARLAWASDAASLSAELTDVRATIAAVRAAGRPAPGMERATPPLERLTVSIGDRTLVIAVATIDWIEAESYYARLHVGDRSYLVRQTMQSLEAALDPHRFARIHRSTIVNIDRVVAVQPFDRRAYTVTLHDGRRLMMSRRRSRLLEFLTS